jgi:hypothetical protein
MSALEQLNDAGAALSRANESPHPPPACPARLPARQKKFGEAEPLLLAGDEGLLARGKTESSVGQPNSP